MVRLLRLLVGMSCRCFRSRRNLLLENLALRQERPKLAWLDKLFWIGMKRIWSEWKNLPRPGYARDGGALAPSRISQLLALTFTARDRLRSQAYQQGSGRTDFPNCGGEQGHWA